MSQPWHCTGLCRYICDVYYISSCLLNVFSCVVYTVLPQRSHLLHNANGALIATATATADTAASGKQREGKFIILLFPIRRRKYREVLLFSWHSPDPSAADTAPSSPARTHNACVHACILASIVAKQASELAFASKGRSMTAPDVIDQIGAAFRKVYREG